jgi:DNA-binding LacI/PurR family transcriptional regulator
VDAAVLLGAFPSALVEQMSRFDVPLLLLDSNHEDVPVDSITTDGFSGGRLIVDYLVKLGHRRIVMAAYELEDYNIATRIRGFEAGLRAHGLPSEEAVMRCFVDHHAGFKILERRLRAPVAPTVVVCVNDTLAVTLSSHLREAGFSVPSDVGLVGFDDDIYAREHSPRLTTIGVDKASLGRAGAQIILDRMKTPDAPVAKLRLPVHLIVRESVLPLDNA